MKPAGPEACMNGKTLDSDVSCAAALGRDGVLRAISSRRTDLAERFSVNKIGLFGSCAREEMNPESDLDIIVDFFEPTFDNYMDLKFFLEDMFGRKVDLVVADAIKPRLVPIIEKEAMYA